LFGGKGRRDRSLIDPGRDAVDEWHDPEQPGTSHRFKAAEPEDDRALPLLRDLRRLQQHQPEQDSGNHGKWVLHGRRNQQAGDDRDRQQGNRDHVRRAHIRTLAAVGTDKQRNECHLGSCLSM
jgi:hypothetical protein